MKHYLSRVLLALSSAAAIIAASCSGNAAYAQVINPSQPATGVPVAGTGISVAGQTVSVNYGVAANTSLQGNALHAPTAIGDTTPNTGAFTSLSASGTLSGLAFSNLFAAPFPFGSTTPNTGAFTTLSTSSLATFNSATVSGTSTHNGATVLTGAVSGAGIDSYIANKPIVQTVLNVAALRTTNCVPGLLYQTQGYYTQSDNASGLYMCNGSDTSTADNGGTIIAAANTFRFYLQYNGRLNIRLFGAKGDGVTNDTTAISNAFATHIPLLAPKGNFLVNNVPVTGNLDLTGIGETGASASVFTCSTINGSIFQGQTTSGDITDIRIANVIGTASAGVTGCSFYTQTSNTNYTAYATFEGIETYLNLQSSYKGFFIFTTWNKDRDGYSGTSPNSIHQFINSLPASYAQSKQTNLNQVIDSDAFGSVGSVAAIQIAYGADWYLRAVDFEGLSNPALSALGIAGGTVQNCWFEVITASYMIDLGVNPPTNQQASANWKIDGGFVSLTNTTVSFINNSSAASYIVDNVFFLQIGAGVVLTNNAPGLLQMSNNTTANGAGAPGFLPKIATGAQNQNVLPIGPSGLGSTNFTLTGYTAASNVASGIGLSTQAVQVTMSASGNSAAYTFPAKLMTFLRGKTITVVISGYAGTATVADAVNVNVWDSITPAYGTGTISSTFMDASVTALQMAYVTTTVGASASSLAVGFTEGGSNGTKTFIIETMTVYVGTVVPLAPSLH